MSLYIQAPVMEDEADELEIPQWTPSLLGYSYRIDYYDDGTIDVPELPASWTLSVDEDGYWSLQSTLEIVNNVEICGDTIEEVFNRANKLLTPLLELM